MSHFPPKSMGFFDTIQVFFMEMTGRTVVFSARDLDLLSGWRARGASAAVICQGLREAALQMPAGDPPRNIHACRKFVEPWVRRAEGLAVGAHEAMEAWSAAPGVVSQEAQVPAHGAFALRERLENIARSQVLVAPVSRAVQVVLLALDAGIQARWIDARDEAVPSEVHDEWPDFESLFLDAVFAELSKETRDAVDHRIREEDPQLARRMSTLAWAEHLLVRRRRHVAAFADVVPVLEALAQA